MSSVLTWRVHSDRCSWFWFPLRAAVSSSWNTLKLAGKPLTQGHKTERSNQWKLHYKEKNILWTTSNCFSSARILPLTKFLFYSHIFLPWRHSNLNSYFFSILVWSQNCSCILPRTDNEQERNLSLNFIYTYNSNNLNAILTISVLHYNKVHCIVIKN